jgi:hypothetical protein
VRLALAGLLTSLVLATPAAADTYCVAPATGCDHTATSMQDGLDHAASRVGDDVVQLGAGTYTVPNTAIALTYAHGANGAVTLQGVGEEQTTITKDGAGPAAGFALIGGDLTVQGGKLNVADLTATSNPGYGYVIGTDGTSFDHVKIITAYGASSFLDGIMIKTAATLSHVTVDADRGICAQTGGTVAITGQITLSDFESVRPSTSDNGCQVNLAGTVAAPIVINRARLSALVPLRLAGGMMTINDSLIQGGTAVQATGSGTTTLIVNQSTIVGSPPASTGLYAENTGSGRTRVALYDSIVRGFTTSLEVASGDATIGGSYDAYATGHTSGSGITISGAVNDPDPLFNPDFSLAAGSPLLDLDPQGLTAGEPSIDIAGDARIIGGKRDLGAFERPLAPTATTTSAFAGTAVQGGAAGGGSAQFIYGTTSAYGSTLPAHALPTSDAAIAVSDPAPGGLAAGTTYHYALRLTVGSVSVTSPDATFTTPAAEPTPPATGTPAPTPTVSLTPVPPGPDQAVIRHPQITELKLSPTRFRAATTGALAATAARHGATLSVTLTLPAATSFAVTRKSGGVRVGKSCLTPSKTRKGKACTRLVKVGRAVSLTLKSGATKVRISGRASGKALKPGRYVLTVTPTGGAPKTVSFQIVR